jgi:hypothetical protein
MATACWAFIVANATLAEPAPTLAFLLVAGRQQGILSTVYAQSDVDALGTGSTTVTRCMQGCQETANHGGIISFSVPNQHIAPK